MTVWVLMTALPVTKGHKALIQFADQYALATGQISKVVLCTQPSEPFTLERMDAVKKIISPLDNTLFHSLHREIEQNPEAEGFWHMWWLILRSFGAHDGDTYIASEAYGKKVAEKMNGKFMPYDPERSIMPIKATQTRHNLFGRWDELSPEFAKHLTRRVTIFGAESTGKTTLAKDLAADRDDSYFVPEYARPYLENTVNEITKSSMTDIWKGQLALQKAAGMWEPRPFIIQDTDLFSTVGYWEFPHWQDTIGGPLAGLVKDAIANKSDLYIVTKSNIPFERDPLRYGGDHREGSDEYWIDICKKYGLNYVVLSQSDFYARYAHANNLVEDCFNVYTEGLVEYVRRNNEPAEVH